MQCDKPEHLPLDLSHIPGAEIVWFNLWDSTDPVWTDEDMGFIRLANGLMIDIGFYGDGRFHVWVVRDRDWENLVENVATSDPREVRDITLRLAAKYAGVLLRPVG